jgi:hypothetical protein
MGRKEHGKFVGSFHSWHGTWPKKVLKSGSYMKTS